MRKKSLFLFFFLLPAFKLHAQVTLDTFIGLTNIPADDEIICEIPIYPEINSDLEGPLEGTLVHDFNLYTLYNDSVQLSVLLNDRKPVLLISCSYTCFVFRDKIDTINNIIEKYGDSINTFLVYTVEAHPVEDVSPYFGIEVVGADNYDDGVLYRQPTTYGERKVLVDSMLSHEIINTSVLIDGPCNEWWQTYGTAPNCAFLIDPEGKVFDAQNWFQKEPENMYASIDSLLNLVQQGVYDHLQQAPPENNLVIYPNPVQHNSTLTIHYLPTNNNTSWFLYNLIGENILSGTIHNSGNTQCNLQNVKAGVYLLKVQDGLKTNHIVVEIIN